MTKKQTELYNNFKNATMMTIWDAYNNPSWNKQKAYHDCVNRCMEMHGGPWAIPTKNTFQFSFAFEYHKDDEKWLHYETANNVYDFKVA